MDYKAWVEMNVEYENKLLEKIKKKHGQTSIQFRKKKEQIEQLKNGNG